MSYPISLAESLQSRANASPAFRKMFDSEAAKGPDSTLWRTMADSIRGTMFRYIKSSNDIQFFEWDAHDIWYQYILLAKNIDAEHPAQDRLARLIVWTRELGLLQRTKKRVELWPEIKGEEGEEMVTQEATTSDGRIWMDLPYLVGDLRDAWEGKMSLMHRQNLVSAIARLAGMGIKDDALSGCGLAIMREALEVRRDVYHDSKDAGKTTCDLGQLSIMDIHPMLMHWLEYAGHRLFRLVHRSFDASAWGTAHTSPGELAVTFGITSIGFSQERFAFWSRRMGQLALSEEKGVREAFRRCHHIVDTIVKEVDSHQAGVL